MTFVTTHKNVNATFNSAKELIEIYYQNPCKVLGVINGNMLATIEAKRKLKGVNGFIITFGIKGGKAQILESTAKSPYSFTQNHYTSEGYDVIQYKDL